MPYAFLVLSEVLLTASLTKLGWSYWKNTQKEHMRLVDVNVSCLCALIVDTMLVRLFPAPDSNLHGLGAFFIFVAPSARNVGLYVWRRGFETQGKEKLETPLLQQEAGEASAHLKTPLASRLARTCAVIAFSCFVLQNFLNIMDTANEAATIAESIGLGLAAFETVLSPFVIGRMLGKYP